MQQEERNKTQEYSEKGLQPLLREVPWEQWGSPMIAFSILPLPPEQSNHSRQYKIICTSYSSLKQAPGDKGGSRMSVSSKLPPAPKKGSFQLVPEDSSWAMCPAP